MCIISPGGSANLIKDVFDESSAKCLVIWLDVEIATLLLRIGNLATRGIVMNEGESFSDLYERRCANYQKNYDIRLLNSNYEVLLRFLKLWY